MRKKDVNTSPSSDNVTNMFFSMLSSILSSLILLALSKAYKLMFGAELNRILFVIFFGVLVVKEVKALSKLIKYILKSSKIYYLKKKKLFLKAETNRELKSNLYYDKTELKKKIWQKVYPVLLKNTFRILGIFVVILVMCGTNPNNTAGCIRTLKEFCRAETNTATVNDEEEDGEEDTDKGIPSENERNAPAGNAQEKEIQESDEYDASLADVEKPEAYRFVLDNPNFEPHFDPEIESRVFCLYENGEKYTNEEIKKCLNEIINSQLQSMNKGKIKDENGNNFYTYTLAEDKFKQAVEKAGGILSYREWQNQAPHSSEMESYIKGREALTGIDGQDGCYELWWRLANDYQYYAQEYQTQTKNGQAILYYYSMSIYCVMKALQYEVTEDEFSMMYKYMAARYRDIVNEREIPLMYRNRSGEIHAVL